ncbi:alpha/beta hydrolase family protein [Nonomuraea sp. NPDC051191]|uniref:alpha/beta hydrolase family protein n=1 Tax=Nonomuraea sp. NPDC051191 TaxID=3364372 RepID=UPI0037A7988E
MVHTIKHLTSVRPRRDRTAVAAGLAAVLAAGLVHASPAAASGTPAPYLPAPTGSRPVGTTSLYLKDTSRPDPWVPSVKARELMVSLWYPARSPGRHRAPYMTAKASELLLKDGGITDLPPDILSRTRTNAFTDARPAGRPRSLPLVVLSPGHSKPRTELTALAEELASRGYVVAAVDHTYENVATSFPDGRVTTCVTCEIDDKGPAWWAKLEKSRAADVSFVLDQLTGAHAKWKGAGLVDPSRIAMAGHSAGGAATVASLLADSRLRAGIDLDGSVETTLPEAGSSRPFLFLGKPATYTPGKGDSAASWERVWTRLNGWKRWLLLTGAAHTSFTDLGVLMDQLGLEDGADVPGTRALAVTRAYVTAFFDQHLRDRPQPLLDKPSADVPEVRFCAPEEETCA